MGIDDRAGSGSGHAVAVVVGASGVVFAAASVIAAIGYPSWMWWFVAAGLVLPPAVALTAVVAWAARRLAHGTVRP